MNLALPAVSRDLGGGITGLQWVADGYTLAFAALLLSAGVAGDRFGPRRGFLAGLALFTVASAGCALAPSIGVLIIVRFAQGAAAALLVPTSSPCCRPATRTGARGPAPSACGAASAGWRPPPARSWAAR